MLQRNKTSLSDDCVPQTASVLDPAPTPVPLSPRRSARDVNWRLSPGRHQDIDTMVIIRVLYFCHLLSLVTASTEVLGAFYVNVKVYP